MMTINTQTTPEIIKTMTENTQRALLITRRPDSSTAENGIPSTGTDAMTCMAESTSDTMSYGEIAILFLL